MGLCQGLQGSAQAVGVHVAAQLPVKGGAPPDVDRDGPGHAVNLVPPAFWNVQGIPRLRKTSCPSVMSVPTGTAMRVPTARASGETPINCRQCPVRMCAESAAHMTPLSTLSDRLSSSHDRSRDHGSQSQHDEAHIRHQDASPMCQVLSASRREDPRSAALVYAQNMVL